MTGDYITGKFELDPGASSDARHFSLFIGMPMPATRRLDLPAIERALREVQQRFAELSRDFPSRAIR